MNCNSKRNRVFIKYVVKILITVIITLIVLILIKSSSSFKTNFYKHVYEKNLSFTSINNIYKRYVGSYIPFNGLALNTKPVFNEKITYNKKESYIDGVKLSVDKNYLIPIQESGIVVYIGEKQNYGNVVIIQQINGVDMWYGNVKNVNVKLYDYVKKGDVLAECEKELYIIYKSDGKVLNYEKYL